MKNTLFNVHEINILITIVELVFLCLILSVWPTRKPQPKWLLVTFFAQVTVVLVATLIIWNSYLQRLAIAQSSLIPAALSFCLLFQGPTLYAYFRSLSEELAVFHWKNLLHLIPPVGAAGVIIAMDIRIVDWLPWNWPNLPSEKHTAIQWIWGFFKTWPLVYVLACIGAEYNFRKKMKGMHSDVSAWQLRWADIILAGFFIHWFWSFIAFHISGYISGEMNDALGIINNYLSVLLVNGLFLFALFSGRHVLLKSRYTPTISGGDAVSDMGDKIKKVNLAIENKDIYLNSQINLKRFSEACGLNSREVSLIINRHYGKNFFEFINALRIEEVKRLLKSNDEMTILEISQESGFNSQSAFHRFFKRLEGVSPSEYRRRARTERKKA